MRPFSAESIARLQQFMRLHAGIELGDDKHFLFENRLGPLLKHHQLENVGQLLDSLESAQSASLNQAVITALTTHETCWNRDSAPFQFLDTLIDHWDAPSLSIWSSACATGQEPYSILFRLFTPDGQCRIDGCQVNVLASDISAQMVKQTQAGIFPASSFLRGGAQEMQQRYFTQLPSGAYQVNPQIRQRLAGVVINLSQPLPFRHQFDLIFCRNVLIYFAADVRQLALRQLHAALKPNGRLVLGSSEFIHDKSLNFDCQLENNFIYYTKR